MYNYQLTTKLTQTSKLFLSKKYSKNLPNCKLYQFPLNSTLATTTTFTNFQQKQLIVIKLYIKTTLNNMFITITTPTQISTTTLSAFGFKGKSKQTLYAYKMFAENNIQNLQQILNSYPNILINIYAKPLNTKLKTFLKLYKSHSIQISKIYDLTPIPYNGCKKKKIAIKKKKKSVIKFLSYR